MREGQRVITESQRQRTCGEKKPVQKRFLVKGKKKPQYSMPETEPLL